MPSNDFAQPIHEVGVEGNQDACSPDEDITMNSGNAFFHELDATCSQSVDEDAKRNTAPKCRKLKRKAKKKELSDPSPKRMVMMSDDEEYRKKKQTAEENNPPKR